MHGDFTRWTFEPQQAYRAVLLQQGRVLLDADWNEQAAITAHHDEVRTSDVVGPDGGPADDAGFAVVTTAMKRPAATPWRDLRITPGRYYVAGTLVEAPARTAPERAGWPLGDQPYVRRLGDDPAVAEPTANGRYAALLDAWTHHVTADERAALLEPALGGPDTTTRAQTVWRVRLIPLESGQDMTTLRAPGFFDAARGTMAALLSKPDGPADPCRLTTNSGGYLGLENQLYRVEIRDTGDSGPEFVWSRENGSVVAALLAITAAVDGSSAELTLDREGPDEELSIKPGDTVEVTGVDLQLRGQAGFLATVTAQRGTRLTVHWTGAAPASLAALGGTPLVRRWEGPARPLDTRPVDLEDGIQVRFPDDGGARATGDHWLIPARTVRLLYGQTATAGSIDWPAGADGEGEALPPSGPVRRTAALAILHKKDDGWTLEADCRRLFPALIHLVTLDPAGGDGQEAPPGSALPQPLRVAARNGGLPLAGARVRFRTAGGRLEGGEGDDTDRIVLCDSDGIAQITWTPDPHGSAAQTVTAELLDHEDARPVVLAGRLSTADRVGFVPPSGCGVFGASESVQSALEKVAGRRMLRLLGGDGQLLRVQDKVLPQPVRVVVDSVCGPVSGAQVVATAGAGGLVLKATGTQPPADLSAAGGQASATVGTGADGSAALWWQPVAAAETDVLRLALQDSPGAPLTVTAQRLRDRVTAAEVSFVPQPGCGVFGASESVESALRKVATRPELRLLGGDGQYLHAADKVLPQPVRAVVDSVCGLVRNAQVVATAGAGGLVLKATGAQPPADLSAAGGQASATVVTGEDGLVTLWWQPAPGASSDTLRLVLQTTPSAAPLTVTAQAPKRGIHITEVKVNGTPEMKLVNSDRLTPAILRRGIFARVDQDIDQRSVNGRGVCYVELDLPWPLTGESSPWGGPHIGVRTVRLPAKSFDPGARFVQWFAQDDTLRWLDNQLQSRLEELPDSARPVVGRFVIEGSAAIGADPALRLNCHASFFLDANGVTRIKLPTDDSVVGGRFVLTFHLDKSLT
jgi:hypothetical protein